MIVGNNQAFGINDDAGPQRLFDPGLARAAAAEKLPENRIVHDAALLHDTGGVDVNHGWSDPAGHRRETEVQLRGIGGHGPFGLRPCRLPRQFARLLGKG